MQQALKAWGSLILAISSVSYAGIAAAAETTFSATYQTGTMNKPLSINGYEPTAAGTYPVFIYVTGTKLSPWSADDQSITQQMAQRGFVAAAVDYSTRMNYPSTCAGLNTAVREIFDNMDPTSAISVVTSRPKANVSKGLVVMGFSQGANIGSLSKNYDAAVQAVFLIGNGYNNMGISCYPDSMTTITGDRMRQAMGANDNAYAFGGYGGNIDANRQVLQTTSGVSCGATATSCIAANGSGWYLVQAFETTDGKDTHCFHYGNRLCGGFPFDANFSSGTAFWSLAPALDWLKTFTTP